MANHPAITPGRVAVITGAASGIGLACAKRFAGLGLKVVLADLGGESLTQAVEQVAAIAKRGATDVCAVPTDVSRPEAMAHLKDTAYEAYGDVGVLMNNAAIAPSRGKPWEDPERWRRVIEVNLLGVFNGVHAFTEAMIGQGLPAAIVNTGSKQGITNPPGGTAYNVAKSGVKALTEQLAFALSTDAPQITAHLLVPGFTFTGMGGARPDSEKPPGAWSSDQVAEFMIDSMGRGDFYILCPDNMVTRAMDERRMRWAADDLIKNRPALSRWLPEFKDAFDAFMS